MLSRAQLPGSRFHCIKDLVFHIAEVEDGWVNGDIRRAAMVQHDIPVLKESPGGPAFAGMDLPVLLDYRRRVETSTLAYLAALGPQDVDRVVQVEDWPDRRLTVDGLLWHEGLTPAHGAVGARYAPGIRRAHCAVSVYCWNETTWPSRKR